MLTLSASMLATVDQFDLTAVNAVALAGVIVALCHQCLLLWKTSVHESGHAIAAWLAGWPVIEVTIGRANDTTGRVRCGSVPQSETDQIVILLAGSAAETVNFSRTLYRLCDRLGLLAKDYGDPTLDFSDLRKARAVSEQLAGSAGLPRSEPWRGPGYPAPKRPEPADLFLLQGYDEAQRILKRHRAALRQLSRRLFRRGRLVPADIESILGPQPSRCE